MILYFDLDTKQLINPPGVAGTVRSVTFIRGDLETLEVHFLRAAAEVAEITNIVAVIKAAPGAESPALAVCQTWTEKESAYTGVLDLNGEDLNTQLAAKPSLALLFELTCFSAGQGPITAATVRCTVQNDLWRGAENAPTQLPDADDWLAQRASTTPTASKLVKAGEDGKIAAGWLPDHSYDLLDSATNSATPETLAKRDADGAVEFAFDPGGIPGTVKLGGATLISGVFDGHNYSIVFEGAIQESITYGLPVSAQGSVFAMTGDPTGIPDSITEAAFTSRIAALTGPITAGGNWQFSSTTRPTTAAATGTPDAKSLLNRDDADARYTSREWLERRVDNFETAMLTAITGTAGPINNTGTASLRPLWSYSPVGNADGASNAQALLGNLYPLSLGGDRDVKNWSKAARVSFQVLHGTSNGLMRFYYGPQSSGWTGGDLLVKGIGFEVSANVVRAVCHNGTTKNTASTGVTLFNRHYVHLAIESDGLGGVRWWVNNIEQTPISGGPTGNSGANQFGFCTESVNPTPATGTFINICNLILAAKM